LAAPINPLEKSKILIGSRLKSSYASLQSISLGISPIAN